MKKLSQKLLSLLLACVLALGLLPGAALATDALPEYGGDWIYFRGNPENNGVTEAKTPASPETAVLKWAQRYGTGWSAAPTPPLILNDQLYIAMSKQVVVIDRDTGAEERRSEEMAGAVGFAMNPIAYGGGRIFVPIDNGQIQALRADTLELLWVNEKSTDRIAQTVSPVIYHNGYVYTGIWGGEEADSYYICLDAATGEQKWKLTHKGGFYWAGAYVNDNYLVVGSDDGSPINSYTPSATLYSLHPTTGEVIDTIPGIKGDIRASVCFDDGKVYFATKGGWFYCVEMEADGKFNQNTLQSVDLKGMCTGTPMIYNGRAYIGSSGAAQFSGPGYLNVIDLSGADPVLAYRAELPGYPQASALATGAYGDTAYVYITYNQSPGGIYAIKDRPGQTEAEGYNLYTPEKAQQNYGICSLVCDSDGTLYYKNDSCYLMAVSNNSAYLSGLTADKGTLKQSFAAGRPDYELIVPLGTEQVTLTATPCEGGAVTINDNPPAPISLTEGRAAARIVVTHEGDTRTYTATIRETSENAALSALAVNESNTFGGGDKPLTPAFDAGTTAYACFDISSGRSFVNLWPAAADPNATVKVYAVSNVDPEDIQEDGTLEITSSSGGHNRYAVYFEDAAKPMAVRLEVTAEDGAASRSYTVLMTKAAAGTISYASSLAMERALLLPEGTATIAVSAENALGGGTPETLTWTSSNPAAATVDQNGVVTYVGKGVTTVTAAGMLASADCTVTCGAPQQGNMYVDVRAYDYTAKAAGLDGASSTGVMMERVVEVPSTSTAAQAVEAAFAAANVDVTISDSGYGPYVSAINGLSAGMGGGMSGWLLDYNNDNFTNLGLGTLTLSGGDRLSFHYAVNPDGATDAVGNGWYGLPILSSLTLAGRTVTMSKETTYNSDYTSQTAYYIHSQQGAKVKLLGAGTAGDPFQIPITLPYGTDLTNLTAAYTTSLNEHYRVVEGLDGARNYTGGLSCSLATLGGHYKTYYKILASTEAGGNTPAPGNTISVSFRLIGSTLSTADVDLGKDSYGGASYLTWLKTATYQLPKDATVYDLFTKALDGAGLRYTGADGNYVDSITAPTAAGGYTLSEFTNGPRAGWMYTVNGKHPGFGLKEWKLREGDKIVWHYVNDYSYEVKDWFDDAGYPSLGDGKYHNAWLKAADTNPTAPGGGTAPSQKEEPDAALKPAATVDKNGEAKARVTAKDMERAVADAKKNGSASIVIRPAVKGAAAKVSVALPSGALAAMAKDTAAKLTLKTDIADISLPAAALSALGKDAGETVSVSAQTVKGADGKSTGEIRLELRVGDKVLDTVEGGFAVTLPVSKPTAGTVLMLVTDEGAKIVRKSAVEGETLAARLSGSATVVVKGNAQTFRDVDKDHWGADAVAFATAHELFRGTDAGSFDPAGEMSRAMLFTVLGRLEGQNAATGGVWYESSMLWAKAQGISDGTNPDGSITREQLATMLCRYAGVLGAETAAGDAAVEKFADARRVSTWAADAVAWAVENDLLRGDGGRLNPDGLATRAEVAAVLQRFVPTLLNV